MSAEDWSLNGKITRTGSGETAASDETGYSKFAAKMSEDQLIR